MDNPLIKKVQRQLDSVDKKVSYAIYSNGQRVMPRLKAFLIALEWSGNGLIWITTTVLLILYNQQQGSMLPKLLIGLIMDIFYVAILKALARRRRPHYAYQSDQMLVVSVDKHSFPSGHCSRASYVAFFTSRYFAHSSPLFTFLVSLWTMSVCTSRLLLGRHYILDCLAGAALGWINFTIQFHSLIPVNLLGMFLIRAMFGSKTFSDPNDMDGMDALE